MSLPGNPPDLPDAIPNGEDVFSHRLAAFRAEIDAMDDELIALIKKRSEVVRQVGALKTEHLAARCFIRPAREALMVKRIAHAFGNDGFSAGAAAAIWRLVIAASTSLEQPLRITAFCQPQQQEAYWLAREYFGMFSTIGKEAVPGRVIGQIMDGQALVGILPALDSGQDDDWWRALLDGDAAQRPHIFACLPYATVGPANAIAGDAAPRPVALAVGYVDCEPTGDDVTYLAIEGKHDLSQSRIHGALADQNLRWLQVLHEPASDRRVHLIELDGFHRQDSPLVRAVLEHCAEQLHRLTVLGAHAKPIQLSH